MNCDHLFLKFHIFISVKIGGSKFLINLMYTFFFQENLYLHFIIGLSIFNSAACLFRLKREKYTNKSGKIMKNVEFVIV